MIKFFRMTKINFCKTFVLLTILSLVISCATPIAYVDYDKEANFDKYTSYNFYAPETDLSLVEEDTIMGFIETNLKAKGLKSQVISKFSIDFYVEFFNVENPIVVDTGYAMFNNDIPYMAITINFSDALTSELFWQAVVERKVPRYMSQEYRVDLYQEFINAALENYPPKPENAEDENKKKEVKENAGEKNKSIQK